MTEENHICNKEVVITQMRETQMLIQDDIKEIKTCVVGTAKEPGLGEMVRVLQMQVGSLLKYKGRQIDWVRWAERGVIAACFAWLFNKVVK